MQKVLMIDNARMMHLAVKARLADQDIEFASAYGGEEGLAAAENFRPDVILLDIDMPEMDGFEVCRRLKANPNTAAVQVVFLTGETSTEQKVKGLNLGAVDYVTKPFDIAELKARVRACLRTKYLLDLLAQHAMIDGLTGLWNRAYLTSRLQGELSLTQRSGGVLSCVMADVDHFKSINDTYGHGVGDQVLQAIAKTMKAQCRNEDIACRYGGEELVILMPNVPAPGAHAAAQRMLGALAALTIPVDSQPLKVTCSFGVADSSQEPSPAIVERADQALYASKRAGRNRVSIFAAADAA
jgi:two-component system, cell cycle response regulator